MTFQLGYLFITIFTSQVILPATTVESTGPCVSIGLFGYRIFSTPVYPFGYSAGANCNLFDGSTDPGAVDIKIVKVNLANDSTDELIIKDLYQEFRISNNDSRNDNYVLRPYNITFHPKHNATKGGFIFLVYPATVPKLCAETMSYLTGDVVENPFYSDEEYDYPIACEMIVKKQDGGNFTLHHKFSTLGENTSLFVNPNYPERNVEDIVKIVNGSAPGGNFTSQQESVSLVLLTRPGEAHDFQFLLV